MPKGIEKNYLPQKVCVICKFTFTWRKKWEKVWDDVRYCSHKCKKNKKLILDSQKNSLKKN